MEDYIKEAQKFAAQEQVLKKEKWKCMCPNCSENAINSHLLQRHGVLSHIAEEGHLYQIEIEDFYKWFKQAPVRFKKVGLQQAISKPLFCNEHDSKLFSSIEGEDIDFDDYKTQLLFSYRGLCSEIREKEFVNIRNNVLDKGLFKQQCSKGNNKGLDDLRRYKYLFEQDLQNQKHKFKFLHLSYSLIKVCASGAVSYEPVNYSNELSVQNALKKKMFDCFFINLIPQSNTLEIVIGYHENHANPDLKKYVESWENLSIEQLQVKITDLFAVRLETWCMSPSLYDSLKDEKKEKFIKTIENVQMNFCYDIKTEINYNLFN